jgi:phospholipid transport system substrate-binding protein
MMRPRACRCLCGMMAVLSVFLLLPGAGMAMAEERGPVELLQDRRDTVLAIVEQDPGVLKDTARLRAIALDYLLPHVDFMTLSRWVMGKYWRAASPEQRRAFADEFRDLLLNNYLRSVTEYRDQTIEFIPVRDLEKKTKVVVHGVVDQPGGPPVHVNFRMHRISGEWLIYDIVVEGVSLATTHRSMFSQQIRDKGLDGVIAELESRNAAAWNENGQSAGDVGANGQPAASRD